MFTTREAQLAYAWSRMASSNRPGSSLQTAAASKRRQEGGLTFPSFMEALCRAAETSLVPSDAWMQALSATDALRFRLMTKANKGACLCIDVVSRRCAMCCCCCTVVLFCRGTVVQCGVSFGGIFGALSLALVGVSVWLEDG